MGLGGRGPCPMQETIPSAAEDEPALPSSHSNRPWRALWAPQEDQSVDRFPAASAS